LGAKPFFSSGLAIAMVTGLWRLATMPGIYSDLRPAVWPALEIVVRPLIEVPDCFCSGVTPTKAAYPQCPDPHPDAHHGGLGDAGQHRLHREPIELVSVHKQLVFKETRPARRVKLSIFANLMPAAS
jgi:hypothetical protein